MFQTVYFYTGLYQIKGGDFKILSSNCINPICYNLPKLVYDQTVRFPENLQKRNKRILNLFEIQKIMNSSSLSVLGLLGLSFGEV